MIEAHEDTCIAVDESLVAGAGTSTGLFMILLYGNGWIPRPVVRCSTTQENQVTPEHHVQYYRNRRHAELVDE